jgi:hypothetical protein
MPSLSAVNPSCVRVDFPPLADLLNPLARHTILFPQGSKRQIGAAHVMLQSSESSGAKLGTSHLSTRANL